MSAPALTLADLLHPFWSMLQLAPPLAGAPDPLDTLHLFVSRSPAVSDEVRAPAPATSLVWPAEQKAAPELFIGNQTRSRRGHMTRRDIGPAPWPANRLPFKLNYEPE